MHTASGLSVIDHMVADLYLTIGWGALRPVLETFQKRLCPAVDPAAHPLVLEVVLGQSAADKYVQATNRVHKWQQNGVEKYGCLFVTCDAESQHRQGEP
jgi:hypothetical protein